MKGNGSTLAAGKSGGGEKPPRHPGRKKSMHELDGAAVIPATPGASTGSKRPAVPTVAGGEEAERFKCQPCQRFFIADEDLQCHIRRSVVSKQRQQEQQTGEAAAVAEAPARPPVVNFAFDSNVPAPEV